MRLRLSGPDTLVQLDQYGSGIGVSRPSGVEATNYWGPGSVPGAGVERAFSTPDTRSSQGFRGGGSASHDTGPPDPSWMDQLAERLGPMIAQEVSRQGKIHSRYCEPPLPRLPFLMQDLLPLQTLLLCLILCQFTLTRRGHQRIYRWSGRFTQ